jgi:formate hydrogenlyase subunit 3/multisubunit Na+/H+ antiporter MnhD subunit
MGVLFLVIGIIITFNGYKQLRRYLDFGEISYFTIVSTFVFGILMLGYGVHSFYQVRKMK